VETVDPQALPGRACSIAAALEVVGDRWSLLVVREVSLGHHRFSEIVRGTGAPRDRLTARLTRLVEAGVLERRPYSDAPPRSDYHLTAAGWELLPVLHSLRQWADTWVVEEPPGQLVHEHAEHGEHVFDGAWTCRTCGSQTRGTKAHMVMRD
jgi:DNA-binding HxlR family transcriptional regulator